MKAVLICLIAASTFLYASSKRNYYWRDYAGKIPSDAFVAGENANGTKLYVGQVYVKDWGLMVAEIEPEVQEVTISTKGKRKRIFHYRIFSVRPIVQEEVSVNPTMSVDDNIKILCGPQDNFFWINVDANNVHLALIGQHAVIGGHEHDKGYINIGRAIHNGEQTIGKINTFSIGKANMFLSDNDGTELTENYEILCYRNKDIYVEKI